VVEGAGFVFGGFELGPAVGFDFQIRGFVIALRTAVYLTDCQTQRRTTLRK
jgi:hypothetical protein